jgi:hypothetical protein
MAAGGAHPFQHSQQADVQEDLHLLPPRHLKPQLQAEPLLGRAPSILLAGRFLSAEPLSLQPSPHAEGQPPVPEAKSTPLETQSGHPGPSGPPENLESKE